MIHFYKKLLQMTWNEVRDKSDRISENMNALLKGIL